MARTKVGTAHYITDCLNCGWRCQSPDTSGSAHRSAAIRHINQNPSHEVHVTLERVLRVTS